MTEAEPATAPEPRTFAASDGYPLHVAAWRPAGRPKGLVVVLHGVQSHSGWYHNLGRNLAAAGYLASFPDRRGSGANRADRGHASSAGRLVRDLVEWARALHAEYPATPIALAGISWGGKLAVIAAARHPELIDALALICPGLQPRVGVSFKEKLLIAWSLVANPRRTFPIPLSDPALFTASPEGQTFIAADPYSLREGTAGLLAASFFIDRAVGRAAARIEQPALLMLAGRDRIIDNASTLAYFDKLRSTDRQVIEYPEGHHTLEFEPNPSRYALDLVAWLDRHLAVGPGRPGSKAHGTDQARAETDQARAEAGRQPAPPPAVEARAPRESRGGAPL
jgi:alpha-beta hydrolase superfamily lysophospholipase